MRERHDETGIGTMIEVAVQQKRADMAMMKTMHDDDDAGNNVGDNDGGDDGDDCDKDDDEGDDNGGGSDNGNNHDGGNDGKMTMMRR